jgi:hypothetical protein
MWLLHGNMGEHVTILKENVKRYCLEKELSG